MTREDEARRLRNEIVMLWKERKQSGGMLRQGIYLWSRLLQLNHCWEELVQLSDPFQDLRLDELPEALPDDIASPSLIAYLKRVRALTLKIRDDLDSAFKAFSSQQKNFYWAIISSLFANLTANLLAGRGEVSFISAIL